MSGTACIASRVIMTLSRRRLLQFAAASAFQALPRAVFAQAWPARPIRLVVGVASGGPEDTLARLVAELLTMRLGQPVEVENNASRDAAAMVARAPADGYTLMLIGPADAIAVSLSQNLDFDFRRDFVPVAGITREPLALVVHPSVPARDVEELFVYAQDHPGRIKLAEAEVGTASQVAGELFRVMTAVEAETARFGSGAAAVDGLVTGEAQAMFAPLSAAIGPVRDGRLRALAVTAAERIVALPALPTMAESLPGFEVRAVYGIAAPRDTPAAIVERLNREVNAAYRDPVVVARMTDGGEVISGTPVEFGKLFGSEIANWSRLLRLARVTR
jgi:tripartite-type tricarboxylate transporter receptor subunit TctC